MSIVVLREKEFLLGLLECLTAGYGQEERFIFEHRFSSIDVGLLEYFPSLKKCDNGIVKKHIYEWFREAEVRGLVENISNEYYAISPFGLKEARYRKTPLKSFLLFNWKYLLPALLSFVGAVVAIIRLTKC